MPESWVVTSSIHPGATALQPIFNIRGTCLVQCPLIPGVLSRSGDMLIGVSIDTVNYCSVPLGVATSESLSTVAVSQSQEIEIFHGQASALHSAGRYQAAAEKYDRLLSMDAADVKAWVGRGCALFELGDFSTALASFQHALTLAPRNRGAWHGRGLVQAQQANYEAALESFEQTIALFPDDVKAQHNRGNALIHLNRPQAAFEAFNAIVQAHPDNYRAWYKRSVALAMMRRYQDALGSLDTTLAIKPNCYYGWTYRGIVLNKLDCLSQARVCFEKSLQHHKQNPRAWYGMAATYALQGQAAQAAQKLEKAIAFNPRLYRTLPLKDVSFRRIIHNPEIQALLQRPVQSMNGHTTSEEYANEFLN